MNNPVGIQTMGSSSSPIYRAALDRIQDFHLFPGAKVADVGGGRGNFSRLLAERGYRVILLDYTPDCSEDAFDVRACDLNKHWPAETGEFDAVISLAVIEHVENPRHFMREVCRIAKPNSQILLSTPNQHSLTSRVCFLTRNQHQHFQDSCYPGHITALLECDLQRISRECGATEQFITYTDHGRIPGTKKKWRRFFPFLRGQLFSDNILFSCRAPG